MSPRSVCCSRSVDSGAGAALDDVRGAYEVHSGQISGTPLDFNDCVRRLDHSFVRVTVSFSGDERLDFQHPSLRDMILSRLRDSSTARRRYIELASPIGLSGLIQGMAASLREGRVPEHVVVPSDEDEIRQLLARIGDLHDAVLLPNHWHQILSAAQLLLPRDQKGRKLPPVEADLDALEQTWEGQVVAAVVSAFGHEGTYDRSRTYTLAQWTVLLSRHLALAAYLVPPPRPRYLAALTSRVPEADAEQAVAFATLIQRSDPLLLRQTVSDHLLRSWHRDVWDRLEELRAIGESIEYPSDWEDWPKELEWVSADGGRVSVSVGWCDYDTWYGEADDLVTLARQFYRWAALKVPQALSDLETLVHTVVGPLEPDWDIEDDLTDTTPAEYWTIETMFEDL